MAPGNFLSALFLALAAAHDRLHEIRRPCAVASCGIGLAGAAVGLAVRHLWLGRAAGGPPFGAKPAGGDRRAGSGARGLRGARQDHADAARLSRRALPPKWRRSSKFPSHGSSEELYRAGICYDDGRFELWFPELITSRSSAASCDAPANPKLPTMPFLGDSHGAHLYPSIKAVFGEKANVLQLDASYCAPLFLEHVDRNAGVTGTERCQLVNRYVLTRVHVLRHEVIVVGANSSFSCKSTAWLCPGFIDEFAKRERRGFAK